ncbi:tRNA nucleotidyltransferase (CCA-adding enzyme) [Wenzhouxiangella marina]|uniref:Multifunctional CCA protein n=1 Tax=Wenzhouxiangella marina TaxID=1579979 RepID=A0A0K0XYZ9_9GAMM|nr:2', 3'-cyclic nucleotide 2'-phosphodiesterase [Wenzhouxiangella marina]MBB6087403.1 tRNA nucleotidyltransferase (CCA-adding enzyme) [Wenzhouxiangella marina]
MGGTEVDDELTRGLDCYQVGGSVRDALLGLTSEDRDYVVVGAGPEEMVRRGFRPVGRDFPVFLHPETHEEYALARTERKSGHGYRGFVFHAGPDVTLEQDLIRRDLTINAMALSADGTLIDPFHGRLDLNERLLRHVSDAFAEDPLRVLRLARFATRFSEFRIAPRTLALCRQMVESGELDHLVPERVWQETRRALMHEQPSRFFDVLRETGALAIVFPEVEALFGVPQPERYHPEIDSGRHTLMVLDQAARLGAPLAVRYACLVHDLGKALTPRAEWPSHRGHEKRGLEPIAEVSRRLAVPSECRDLALKVGEFHLHSHRALELRPATVLRLFEQLDAFRKPERLTHFLLACQADLRGRLGREDDPYPQGEFLRRAHAAAAEVEARPFVEQGLEGPAIAEAMARERQRRIECLRAELDA